MSCSGSRAKRSAHEAFGSSTPASKAACFLAASALAAAFERAAISSMESAEAETDRLNLIGAPAAVARDELERARNDKVNVLCACTAGRAPPRVARLETSRAATACARDSRPYRWPPWRVVRPRMRQNRRSHRLAPWTPGASRRVASLHADAAAQTSPNFGIQTCKKGEGGKGGGGLVPPVRCQSHTLATDITAASLRLPRATP